MHEATEGVSMLRDGMILLGFGLAFVLLFRKLGLAPLAQRRLLEIGCGYGDNLSADSRTDGRPYTTSPVSPAAFDPASHSPIRWLYQIDGMVAWTTPDARVPTTATTAIIRLKPRIQAPGADSEGASAPAASTAAGASCRR